MTRTFATAIFVAAGLAACSQGETPTGDTAPADKPSATASPGGDAMRALAYTKLSECKTVKEEHEEGQYLEEDCPGLGGYTLRASVGDLRANLAVIGKDGKATSLDLSRIGGGGFSALGEMLEWRGPATDPLKPDSLIFRYNVVEKPDTSAEVSYLLVAKLGAEPCVIAKVPPGPGQNARARDLADGGGACLPG